MVNRSTALLAAALASAGLLAADASYQETTQITGGSALEMMKMAGVFSSRAKQASAPVTSTVMIHGNQMVRVKPLAAEIIDLDKQTITYVDTQKQQYSVVTFAQLRDAMKRAAERMKENKKAPPDSSANVSFSAKVKETGATKPIAGQEAKEAIMTLSMDASSTDGSNAKGSMAITSDLWLIPDAPGYQEVRSFNTRMAQELAVDMNMSGMAAMLNAQPGASQGLADMKKEMAKMSGIPVIQTMRMGITANGEPLPAPTADAAPADNNESKGLGGLGKALAGASPFGGFRKHKSNDAPVPSNSSGSSGALLETSTQLSNFSADAVKTTAFEVPAGYKQVTSPMERQ